MSGNQKRGWAIREFLLSNVDRHPNNLGAVAARRFRVTRQAINHHIRKLVDQNVLVVEGTRSRPKYFERPEFEWRKEYPLDGALEEDVVWRNGVAPELINFSNNAMEIWEYGTTEMVNNVIDHSEGEELDVYLGRYATYTLLYICDDGVGIFQKIQNAMQLEDERHAVLELAKGKFTTDPDNHTGEGIFFSSRMFDEFNILSGDVYYAHDYDSPTEWIAEAIKQMQGTVVYMKLKNKCNRSITNVFDEYAGADDYGFTKTVVPVRMAQYGDDTLVSRSQAKRLLARIDRFEHVIFDFKNVKTIGQAFADEIFRVFARRHPEIEIEATHTVPKVKKMISRAKSA